VTGLARLLLGSWLAALTWQARGAWAALGALPPFRFMVSRKPKTRSPRPAESLAEEAAAAAALLAAAASATGIPRIASGLFGRGHTKMIRRVLLYCYIAALLLTGAAIFLKPTYCDLTTL